MSHVTIKPLPLYRSLILRFKVRKKFPDLIREATAKVVKNRSV